MRVCGILHRREVHTYQGNIWLVHNSCRELIAVIGWPRGRIQTLELRRAGLRNFVHPPACLSLFPSYTLAHSHSLAYSLTHIHTRPLSLSFVYSLADTFNSLSCRFFTRKNKAFFNNFRTRHRRLSSSLLIYEILYDRMPRISKFIQTSCWILSQKCRRILK